MPELILFILTFICVKYLLMCFISWLDVKVYWVPLTEAAEFCLTPDALRFHILFSSFLFKTLPHFTSLRSHGGSSFQ